jgi:carbonic anhydrase/acetyltransferase-like protein (isoleucine patch superfamily)
MAQLASSARLLGAAEMAADAYLAPGAVVRSIDGALDIGAGSAVLENCVVIATADLPARIGRKTVFGHRCVVVGATVGDLCEIGNASVLGPGARLGDRVFLGEGTVVPSGAVIPDDAVVVGRPGRVIRRASPDDLARLARLRDGDLSLPPDERLTTRATPEDTMATLHPFRGTLPRVAESATLFGTAELTGDIVVGEHSIIGAGVKIVGDSHGPVRIGDRVQILENTVLHLLPDNELVVEDDVVIGPGAMIHGCHLGPRTIVEPGAIVCDWSRLGADCVVKAGAVVKQRSTFGDGTVVDGFPAAAVGATTSPLTPPGWAFRPGDVDAVRRA